MTELPQMIQPAQMLQLPQMYAVTYRSKFSLGIFPIEKLIFVSEIN